MKKLNPRNIYDDLNDYVSYYRRAKNKDPERILLTQDAIKKLRKKMKQEEGPIFWHGIPVEEQTNVGTLERN